MTDKEKAIRRDTEYLIADSLDDFIGWEILCREPFKQGVEIVTARRQMDSVNKFECIRVYTSVSDLRRTEINTDSPEATIESDNNRAEWEQREREKDLPYVVMWIGLYGLPSIKHFETLKEAKGQVDYLRLLGRESSLLCTVPKENRDD